MSDIDLAVRESRRLESLLAKRFNATGRGLHEKVSSVSQRLPLPLVKKLRYIASVRNKVVHNEDAAIDDRRGFRRACRTAHAELTALGTPIDTWKQTLRVIGYMAAFLTGGAMVIYFVMQNVGD